MAASLRLYAVPALEKGLDVLEALAARAVPASPSEVARRLGRSPSEIFRILLCLERRGYLVKEEGSGRVRLSLRLYELAHAHSPIQELLRAAERPMRELARLMRESCHLSVLGGGRLLVLSQVESPERIRFSVEVGGRFPVLHTCSGRLLLAHLPKGELEGLLARDPDWKALGPAERRRFLGSLLEVRRARVSVAESETFQGVRDVAALVGNPAVGAAAALCVPALKVRGRWPTVADHRRSVERAAGEITRALGLTAKVE